MNSEGWFPLEVDWFDFFVVQGPCRSLLQHQSWKVSVLQHSAFFIAQISHLHMTTEQNLKKYPRTVADIQGLAGMLASLKVCSVKSDAENLLIYQITVNEAHVGFVIITDSATF